MWALRRGAAVFRSCRLTSFLVTPPTPTGNNYRAYCSGRSYAHDHMHGYVRKAGSCGWRLHASGNAVLITWWWWWGWRGWACEGGAAGRVACGVAHQLVLAGRNSTWARSWVWGCVRVREGGAGRPAYLHYCPRMVSQTMHQQASGNSVTCMAVAHDAHRAAALPVSEISGANTQRQHKHWWPVWNQGW